MTKRKSAQKRRSSRIVEYCPTPGEKIDAYARAVCQHMGQNVDSGYDTPETIRDLAAFLRIASTIWAKYMNRRDMK